MLAQDFHLHSSLTSLASWVSQLVDQYFVGDHPTHSYQIRPCFSDSSALEFVCQMQLFSVHRYDDINKHNSEEQI